MRIVMDFDGVYTDPSDEGEECSKNFRDKILSLKLQGLETLAQVEAWLGELRVRQSREPFKYGWRSEGRISAFTFEDPFIRNIGLADYLDHLVRSGDTRAKTVLNALQKKEAIENFGSLSEWSFHQLKLKKKPDAQGIKWVREQIRAGHEVLIISNSTTDKIDAFLTQNEFDAVDRPKVSGGAKKFGLGTRAQKIKVAVSPIFGNIEVDTDRPMYEKALMEIRPDAVIGDVFSLDLALPLRLKREGKLELKGGIFYRLRDYTPTSFLEFVSIRHSLVPEITSVRDWSLKL